MQRPSLGTILSCGPLRCGITKQTITFSSSKAPSAAVGDFEKIWGNGSASLQINGLTIIKLLSA